MTNLPKLSDRQRQFVHEYLVDLNATRAAVRAGYSPRNPASRGWALKRNPAVAAEIDAAMAGRARVAGITPDRVLFEISLLGFANIMDYLGTGENGMAWLDLARLTREQGAAITAIELDGRDTRGGPARRVKIKLADKSRSLELMGRHLGLFAHAPARASAIPKANARDANTPGEDKMERAKQSEEALYQDVLDFLAFEGKHVTGGTGR